MLLDKIGFSLKEEDENLDTTTLNLEGERGGVKRSFYIKL